MTMAWKRRFTTFLSLFLSFGDWVLLDWASLELYYGIYSTAGQYYERHLLTAGPELGKFTQQRRRSGSNIRNFGTTLRLELVATIAEIMVLYPYRDKPAGGNRKENGTDRI
jgi:hypothetical protein